MSRTRSAAPGIAGKATAHEAFVLALVEEVEAVDEATLARAMGSGSVAYRKVAREILSRMEARGLLWRNDSGQYRAGHTLHAPDVDPLAGLTRVLRCGERPGAGPGDHPTLRSALDAVAEPTPADLVSRQPGWETCLRKMKALYDREADGFSRFFVLVIGRKPDGTYREVDL